MTVEVRNRSSESWGPLADTDEKTFCDLINGRDAKVNLKEYIKKQKKLKTYKVKFIQQIVSDSFFIKAEDEWNLHKHARNFFEENKKTIDFNREKSNTYDNISYVKVN